MKIQIIEIKTGSIGLKKKISVIQEDTARQLRCILSDFIIPDGSAARIYAIKPSGNKIYNDGVIEGNTVLVDITTQLIAEIGEVACQVEITEPNGNVLTSFEFVIEVKKRLKDASAIESTNEYKALESALEKTQGLDARINSEVSERKSEYAVLSARMDTFTVLEEGSTTGDAELIDARVGADGSTYSNVGGNIRNQGSDIIYLNNKSICFDVEKIHLNDMKGWDDGHIWLCNKSNVPTDWVNSTVGMTGFIKVKKGDIVNVYFGSGYSTGTALHITEYPAVTTDFNTMLNTVSSSITVSRNGRATYTVSNENANYIRVGFTTMYKDTCVIGINKEIGNDIPNEFYNKRHNAFDDFIAMKNVMQVMGVCSENLYNIDTITEYTTLSNGLRIVATDFIDCIEDDIFVCNYFYSNINYVVNLYDSTSDDKLSQIVIRNGDKAFRIPQGIKRIRLILTTAEKNFFEIYRIRTKSIKNISVDCIGDSICQGYVGYIGEEYVFAHPTWQDSVSGKLGAIFVNYGEGGSGYMTTGQKGHTMLQNFNNIETRSDWCLLFGGVNDRNYAKVQLGDMTSTSGSDTIYGKIKELLTSAATTYNNKVFVISPIRDINYGVNNSYGYNLGTLTDALKNVADSLNLPFLNLYNDGVFNPSLDTHSVDGIHPTQLVIDNYIATRIYEFIRNYIN